MASHLARAAGNMARANPRLYSTQAEPAFAHRNAPPMPSLDHLAQPEQDFVSLLTHRVHSILGSAWYSLQAPTWMQFVPAMAPAAQSAPKPAIAFATEEPITRANVALAFQQERGWSYYGEEQETGFSNGKVRLYSPILPFSDTVRRALSPLPKEKPSFSLSYLYACALVDVANHTMDHQKKSESPSFFTEEHRAMFQNYYNAIAEQRKVALVRVPVDHSPLDGYKFDAMQSEVPSLQYMDAPRSPGAQRVQLIAAVALATGIAVAGAAASLTAWFRKW